VVNVGTPGDLIAVNNTAESSTAVASAPEPQLVITAGPLLAGQLASAKVTIPAPFPFDITGNLKFAFLSNATNPTDDPAIQFETGGRAVSFVIPANTMEARFGNLQLAQVALQTGTVSGTLTFEGRLQVGTLETSASTARSVAPKPPMIHSIKRTSEDGPAVVITLSSTMRSVTGLRVEFFAGPPVQLSCGAVTGCSVSGITLTFDVKSLFDDWYRTDTRYGSLATLRLPFSIPNTVRGTVSFTLVNALGASARVFLTLP
jgi:hypothetical protein